MNPRPNGTGKMSSLDILFGIVMFAAVLAARVYQ
jgi:hypothetical protein